MTTELLSQIWVTVNSISKKLAKQAQSYIDTGLEKIRDSLGHLDKEIK